MRSDDDQWDITTSVGMSALIVASGRAIETQRSDGLIDDPFARAFVEAAAPSVSLPSRLDPDEAWTTQSTYIGLRSRFFDRFFADASAGEIRQVVLLAAGLDTRAFRLDWPADSTVYEIDRAEVLGFKDEVLTSRGAIGGAHRVVVPVDLRHDWTAALRDAGFDPAQLTAWLAEGLLPYLPARTEADLFARVQDLSAPGSRIAVEHFAQSAAKINNHPSFRTVAERFGVNVAEMLYDEPRQDPVELLTANGWDVTTSSVADLARACGRLLDDDIVDLMGKIALLQAIRRG